MDVLGNLQRQRSERVMARFIVRRSMMSADELAACVFTKICDGYLGYINSHFEIGDAIREAQYRCERDRVLSRGRWEG